MIQQQDDGLLSMESCCADNASLCADDLSMEACCAIKYFPEVDSLQSEKVSFSNFYSYAFLRSIPEN